ncbi:DUF4307 domain-containing protein [Actinoplanes sp. TBRC 11911]|uniref:DUF4307 domain-containing protein n=1 Tax=Actinoplanes sp. TBRC 11911 TaxID=2729386 RepID=UPI00145FCC21|nr:DUF4307 domain-containing protein [Actinoplanes sp. TBRC 11911]NMO51018.1 DUF4307 domain-containing protein [Actinoplanes sp. TBRC 11911]
MSETHTTLPVYPPGRYGRRRSGRRRRVLPLALLALVIVASLLLSVRLYQQYGESDYKAQIVGWTATTATSMNIEFKVQVPAGRAASCTLRARDYGGNELGRRTVVVRPTGDATTIQAKESVPTTAKGSVGDVLGCQPAD